MTGAQLSLFKGKRQRGVRPPAAKEFSVHTLVASILERWVMPGWRYTHIPSGEKRSKATAGKLKRMGVKRGWPDFIFLSKDGFFALELKRRGENPTDEQREIGHAWAEAGGQYRWVDSYERAEAALKEWGVLPSRIETIDGVTVVRRA